MDRTPHRREKLLKAFKADQIDALLISSPTNVRYLTGFTGDDSTLLLTRDRATVLSDGRYTTQLKQECPNLELVIRPVGQTMTSAIAETVGKLEVRARLRTVGAHRRRVRESEAAVPAQHGVRSGQEPGRGAAGDQGQGGGGRNPPGHRHGRACVRDAACGASAARRARRTRPTPWRGISRRCGASAASFPPIIAVGERSALPHARPTAAKRIEEADFVLVDWGATASPYKSDLTRVLVTGKVTSKFEKVYRTVLAAQERGSPRFARGSRPEMSTPKPAPSSRTPVSAVFFTHGLGHGLGMDIHEAPALRKESGVTLQPGMVITVEPGIYLPGWGGIRIEDDVLVTPDGCEVLTHVPKSLDTVRVS